MSKIVKGYKDLFKIIFSEAPIMVILTLLLTVVKGLLIPVGVGINIRIFDDGLLAAQSEIPFSEYVVVLILFLVIALLPFIIDGIIFNYVGPRSFMILRTTHKARMLKKLEKIKYEHFEDQSSIEIIDKTYSRAEGSARNLWPRYVTNWLSSVIAITGVLILIVNIRWWLILSILIPFIIETHIAFKTNYNMYREMEIYWKEERKYGILGSYLRSRNYFGEIKLFKNASYLINKHKSRLKERNKIYEHYFYKNLKFVLFGNSLTKISSLANTLILLILYINGQMSIGTFISISILLFRDINIILYRVAFLFKEAIYDIQFFEYYEKFFDLPEESDFYEDEIPKNFTVEFNEVWFRYPGAQKDVLKGISFKIKDGEKVSIVGENGEGKSTIIKLLLGLFTPDSGEILVGGKQVRRLAPKLRAKIFGCVFQDYIRYSISVKENIGIGDIDELEDNESIIKAAKKGKADTFIDKFANGYDTLLGRDFVNGIEISGGQWQRIALSRALMGDKPIVLLDEPTSQFDPISEVNLYNEFASIVKNKTSIFITHRLGSTIVTDRILVVKDGIIQESGTHEILMVNNGIYSKMFNMQLKWYVKDESNNEFGES